MARWLAGQERTLIGPLEGSGLGAIVVRDEGERLGGEVLDGGEGAAAEELAGEDRQPDLDLVEPGAVVGRVVEDDPMGGVAEEGGPGLARGQDPALALDA